MNNMKAYGVFRSNLVKLCNEINNDINFSIDSLTFQTKNGEQFDIDFEEGDFNKNKSNLNFRLKSMGSTFFDSIEKVYNGEPIDIEGDYNFFRDCKLTQISIYIYDGNGDQYITDKLNIKLARIKLIIRDRSLYYHTAKVVCNIN